ncbi:MAG: Na/Pi symporter [Helicobacter sp.]|nr:Na/Pi symporter [Helicobacter sp.]
MDNIRQALMVVFIVLGLYFLSINAALTQILAGVAILLFGIMNLGNGFKSFSDGLLEKILQKSTSNTFKSIVFGTIATVIMQSSTLVSVISISFLSAGLITLAKGLAVVFGANLGNSAGSWLIVGVSSVKISDFALPLIVVGMILTFLKSKAAKGVGNIFIGLGFFFLGVSFIKEGFEAMGDTINFDDYKADGYMGVLIYVGVGALLTGIVQSSHATLAMILIAFSTGEITYDNALAATLGTSVGGVVTALVASLSSNIEGKKLAVGNCVFNFSIAIIVIAMFFPFVEMVNFIASIVGIPESNAALRVALFHTMFNLFGVVLITPFIPLIVKFLDKIIQSHQDKDRSAPRFINPEIVAYPEVAIEAIEKEVIHLYDNAFAIISHTIGFKREDIRSKENFEDIIKRPWYKGEVDIDYLYQKKIKALFDSIINFSTETQPHTRDHEQRERIFTLMTASRSILEAIKILKLAQKNLKSHALSPNHNLSEVYNEMRIGLGMLLRSGEELKEMSEENVALIVQQLSNAKSMFEERDKEMLRKVEGLISEKKITVSNGTSILNDSSFMDSIIKEVITAIQIIYTKYVPRGKEDDDDTFDEVEENTTS